MESIVGFQDPICHEASLHQLRPTERQLSGLNSYVLNRITNGRRSDRYKVNASTRTSTLSAPAYSA